MTFEWVDEHALCPEGFPALAEDVARECLILEGVPRAAATIMLVTADEIRALNRETRGVDSETDVLSFPSVNYAPGRTAGNSPTRLKHAYVPERKMVHLGDIVINMARAAAQAEEYGHSLKREMGYLTAHAMFHLLGYDHMTDADKQKMRAMEKRAMRNLKLFRGEDEPMSDEQLMRLAVEAKENSYSPYSNFRVGACILCEDGRVFQGANFENASFGATICAERCAVGNAIVNGARRFTAIAIASDKGYAWPCGICRQVLNEFAPKLRVLVSAPDGGWVEKRLNEILPESFGPKDLDKDTEE